MIGDPLHGDIFTAARGQGAFRNGNRIEVSAATEMSRSLVPPASAMTLRGGAPRGSRGPATGRGRGHPQDGLGCGRFVLCRLRRVDAYFERGLNRWDYAAGVVIATEAGAVVGDLAGGPPTKRFTFAAAPGIAAPLAELLGDLGADRI